MEIWNASYILCENFGQLCRILKHYGRIRIEGRSYVEKWIHLRKIILSVLEDNSPFK